MRRYRTVSNHGYAGGVPSTGTLRPRGWYPEPRDRGGEARATRAHYDSSTTNRVDPLTPEYPPARPTPGPVEGEQWPTVDSRKSGSIGIGVTFGPVAIAAGSDSIRVGTDVAVGFEVTTSDSMGRDSQIYEVPPGEDLLINAPQVELVSVRNITGGGTDITVTARYQRRTGERI